MFRSVAFAQTFIVSGGDQIYEAAFFFFLVVSEQVSRVGKQSLFILSDGNFMNLSSV